MAGVYGRKLSHRSSSLIRNGSITGDFVEQHILRRKTREPQIDVVSAGNEVSGVIQPFAALGVLDLIITQTQGSEFCKGVSLVLMAVAPPSVR